MALPDALTDPVPLAILTLAIFAAIQYQRTLSWPEYRAIHRFKLRVFPSLGPPFVHVKRRPEHDDEYLTTRDAPVRAVWQSLVDAGGSPHIISSVKQRPGADGGVEFSQAHVVWFHEDGSQTEAYIFGDGSVYAHHEPSVQDPEAHLSGPQTDGDPKGVVRMALGMPLPEAE